MMSVSSCDTDLSEPQVPPDSPGSCVSSRLQDEYDELLKYAVVVPSYDIGSLPQTLADLRGSFPLPSTQGTNLTVQTDEGDYGEEEDTVEEEEYDDEEEDEEDEEDEPSVTAAEAEDAERQRDCGSGVETDSIDAIPLLNDPQENFHSPHHTGYQQTSHGFLATQKMNLGTMFTEDSERSSTPVGEGTAEFTGVGVDRDVVRMENLLDQWTGELKRNVLAEFGQSKIRLMEQSRFQMKKEKERHASEVTQMQNELESMKELLLTYEQSIERKDQVISNLTRGLQKQKEKFDMLKTFCDWKLKHNDTKREAFASNLAYKHHRHSLQRKCWDAWHSVVESRWRQRVEKACQAKAQEVCMSLTNDYETKVASLNEALESARVEVSRLHAQRDGYEETMKKAFMRGVCALNMEAMAMFHDSENKGGRPEDQQELPPGGATEDGTFTGEDDQGYSHTISHEPVFTSEPHGAPAPRVVSGQGAVRNTGMAPQPRSMMASKSGGTRQPKVIKAKVTAKADGRGSTLGGGGGTLAPPMSSVVVERYQPVTKQTVGHATASKFPKQPTSQPGQGPTIVQRKIAGQAGQVPIATPNIQTVRVVQ